MPQCRTRPLLGLFAVLLGLLLAGCYKDEAVVTIHADGSGTFAQTIRISEQMVVAMNAENRGMGFSDDAPFDVSREELEGKLGGAGTITEFEIEDLADGGKLITVRGTFEEANAFFASEYADDSLNLAIESEGDGRAALTWVAQEEDQQNGPSLDQIYGMAKGLKVVRRVNLPSAPESDQGVIDGRSVAWAMDLSDREALAATKALVEASEDGVLVARFDSGAIDFAAPAPVAAVGPGPVVVEAGVEAPVDTSGMEVVIHSATLTRSVALSDDAWVQDPALTLDLQLNWPEGSRPLAVYGGELKTLVDDLGHSLVPEADDDARQNRSDIWEHSDNQTFRIEAIAPDHAATKVTGLTGQLRVVTQVNVETVSFDQPTALIGKATTGSETLDALGFKIESIDGNSVGVSFKEGVEANDILQTLNATLADGTVIESNGWGGWANNMNYNFPEDVSGLSNLTLKVLTGETVVAVPFAIDEIELP